MKHFETEIQFASTERTYIADITGDVNGILEETRTQSGIVILTSLHTTLGLLVNEGREKNLLYDMLDIARNLIPEDEKGSWVRGGQEYPFPIAKYRHYCGDNPDLAPGETEDDRNASRHARAEGFSKPQLERVYREGSLLLGRFQRMLIFEHDGRSDPVRERRIHVLVNPFEGPVEKLAIRRLTENAGYKAEQR